MDTTISGLRFRVRVLGFTGKIVSEKRNLVVQSPGPKKFTLFFQKGFYIPKKFKVWMQDYWDYLGLGFRVRALGFTGKFSADALKTPTASS